VEKREEESAVWGSVEECSSEVGVIPAGRSRGGEDGLRGRGRAQREREGGEGEGNSREGGSAEENRGRRDGERMRERERKRVGCRDGERVTESREAGREGMERRREEDRE